MPITLSKNQVPWNIWEVIWIFLFILGINLFTIITLKHFNIDYKNLGVSFSFQIIMSLVYVGLVIIFIKTRYKVSVVESLGLKIDKNTLWTYISGGIFVGLSIILFSALISFYFIHIINRPIENPYANYSLEKLKMVAVLAIFLAPIVEEVFFRGFVQPAICQSVGNYQGILTVAIFFAVLHSQYSKYPEAMVIMLGLSLILGFSRLHFNSIIPGMIGHFINNVLAAAAVFIGSHG